MFKDLIKHIIQGKLYCAVEHSIIEQKIQINYLFLKKRKSEFLIEKSDVFTNTNDLFKVLKKNQHLFLIINDDQVLTKAIKGKQDTQKAVQTAFPNLNRDDFYYEVYQNKTNTYISICRKEHIDSIIKQYEEAYLNIIGFSLGNLVGTQLLPFVEERELQTSNAFLSIKNHEITNIKKIEEKFQNDYIINDLKVNSNSVLGLAGILSFYTGQRFTQNSFIDKINLLQDRFKQKRFFDLGLKTSLSFIFILLLISFLFFSSYRKKVNNIKSEIEVNENYRGNLFSLKKEVNRKKKIVEEITSSETSKVSLYLDKIGASIPNKVLLNQLNYQPFLKNIKKGKEIRYQSQKIFIEGKSLDGAIFSEWISSLEQEKWIDKISVVNYGIGKKTITEFQLNITLAK